MNYLIITFLNVKVLAVMVALAMSLFYFFIFSMVIVDVVLNELIDNYWKIIGNDIKTIYKEIIKFLKFYTNV